MEGKNRDQSHPIGITDNFSAEYSGKHKQKPYRNFNQGWFITGRQNKTGELKYDFNKRIIIK